MTDQAQQQTPKRSLHMCDVGESILQIPVGCYAPPYKVLRSTVPLVLDGVDHVQETYTLGTLSLTDQQLLLVFKLVYPYLVANKCSLYIHEVGGPGRWLDLDRFHYARMITRLRLVCAAFYYDPGLSFLCLKSPSNKVRSFPFDDASISYMSLYLTNTRRLCYMRRDDYPSLRVDRTFYLGRSTILPYPGRYTLHTRNLFGDAEGSASAYVADNFPRLCLLTYIMATTPNTGQYLSYRDFVAIVPDWRTGLAGAAAGIVIPGEPDAREKYISRRMLGNLRRLGATAPHDAVYLAGRSSATSAMVFSQICKTDGLREYRILEDGTKEPFRLHPIQRLAHFLKVWFKMVPWEQSQNAPFIIPIQHNKRTA